MKHKNLLFGALFFGGILFSDIGFCQGMLRYQRWQRVHQPVHVKVYPELGICFGHDFNTENFMFGGHLVLPAGRFWSFVPSVDYEIPETNSDLKRWQFNGDLVFKPHPAGMLFLGGGVAVEHKIFAQRNDRTNVGGNAIVGLEFGNRSPMKFFVQSRWTFVDKTYFSVLGGLNFVLR